MFNNSFVHCESFLVDSPVLPQIYRSPFEARLLLSRGRWGGGWRGGGGCFTFDVQAHFGVRRPFTGVFNPYFHTTDLVINSLFLQSAECFETN